MDILLALYPLLMRPQAFRSDWPILLCVALPIRQIDASPEETGTPDRQEGILRQEEEVHLPTQTTPK